MRPFKPLIRNYFVSGMLVDYVTEDATKHNESWPATGKLPRAFHQARLASKISEKLPNRGIARARSRPLRVTRFGTGAAPPRAAAAPASNHLATKPRQRYKPSETSKTLLATVPPASSSDDGRLQARQCRQMYRSWHQFVEQLRDTQLRCPLVNIVEINGPREELLNIAPLHLGVGFQRPDQLR